MSLGGDQMEFKKKEEFFFDTKKKSELLKDENETNGYNLIVEPPKLKEKTEKKFDKKEISANKGKTVTEQIKKMVNSEEQLLSKEGSDNLNLLSRSIFSITDFLDDKMPMPAMDKEKKVSKQSMAECMTRMNVSLDKVEQKYDNLIMNLDKCIQNENGETNNPEFKRVLKELKKQCEEEKECFKDKALQYQSLFINDPLRKGKVPTWGEALEFARSEYYDLADMGKSFIKVKEDSSTKVMRIKEQDKDKTLTIDKDSQDGNDQTLQKNSRVAATKMAGALGVSDMVCTSKTAYVKDGDGLFRATITEDSGGINMERDMHEQQSMEFAVKALSEMFQLQTLDAICGLQARGYDNMDVLKNDEGVITGIKAIDLFEKPVTANVIAALPTEFLNKIFNIQKPVLDIIFAGTLSSVEIDKVWDRIYKLQMTISKCFRYDLKYREEMAMRDNFYREAYLSYEKGFEDDDHRMLQAVNKMQEKNEIKDTNLPDNFGVEQNN